MALTLKDLIRRFRVMAEDKSEPFFWADDEIRDWLNDAQAQACIRGRLIREDANPSVCRIAMDPGEHTYKLHQAVYEIIDLRMQTQGPERNRKMELRSREWLDTNHPDWREIDTPTCWAIQNDTSIRVVGKVNTGDSLSMECYRLPLRALKDAIDKPEIHDAHHEHLVHWALHKAFSIPDADGYDPVRSATAAKAFASYFGDLPDSDMRRITREDVAHHNVAYFP